MPFIFEKTNNWRGIEVKVNQNGFGVEEIYKFFKWTDESGSEDGF